jgi:hypothetical protein
MLDGNGVKAIQGSITAPNPGSSIFEKKENKGSRMGERRKNNTI